MVVPVDTDVLLKIVGEPKHAVGALNEAVGCGLTTTGIVTEAVQVLAPVAMSVAE